MLDWLKSSLPARAGLAVALIACLALSSAFSAVLIGLGIDFAIHYVASYLNLRRQGCNEEQALLRTAVEVGPGMVTGGVTTAAAFFMAAMTDFVGVRELGLVAGGGILLCVLATVVVLPPLVLLDGVHGADARVIERRGSPRLALEALQHGRVARQLGREELERHAAPEPRVLGLVDDPHAAGAELPPHLEPLGPPEHLGGIPLHGGRLTHHRAILRTCAVSPSSCGRAL